MNDWDELYLEVILDHNKNPRNKKKCNGVKKRITVTSTKGIYKRSTNQNYSWLIFTSPSWETNTIN